MRKTLVLVALLAMAGVAAAQTPVIVAGPPESVRLLPDQNITQALRMIGCDGAWLSAVVTENKIPPDTLGKLPFGNVYALPAGADCRQPAPPAVAELTKALVATRAAGSRISSLQANVTRLEGEIESLKAEVASATAATERATAAGRVCADDKVRVEAQVQTITQERDTAQAELAARWSAMSGFLLGLLVSAIACAVWFFVRRQAA